MASPLVQLLVFLEDEFRDLPDLRIRTVAPSTTRRALDLEQDYDPESSDVHRVTGVRIQCKKREYFFPEEWMREGRRSEIEQQIRVIREAIADGVA